LIHRNHTIGNLLTGHGIFPDAHPMTKMLASTQRRKLSGVLPLWLTRIPTGVIAGCTVFFLFIVFLLTSDATSSALSRPSTSSSGGKDCTGTGTGRDVIPNMAHFVYILPKDKTDFSFKFSDFLSIYGAWYYWKPDALYLHTNVKPTGDEVARARNGTMGKWTQLIFNNPKFKLTVNTVSVPDEAENGRNITAMEHKSDFVRVKAVHDLGGIYIDWDVHPLRDIKPLRESGFKAVGGRQKGGQINSGTFMSAKGGKMITYWMERMHKVYDGRWTTHSNEVITRVGQRLIGTDSGEMLIVDQPAFAPGGWDIEDNRWLFSIRNGTESNIPDGFKQGDHLPAFTGEGFTDRWDQPDRYPDWEHDWSDTYLLHAFSPARYHREIEGFDGRITPAYVLGRQSNFARAVYPVAKALYDEGLIDIDDNHLGKPEEEVPEDLVPEAAEDEFEDAPEA